MADLSNSSPTRRAAPGQGAAVLTLGGLLAAFGLASCCALPLLLTMLGFGAAWLGGVALFAASHRGPLLAFGALSLLGGAILLWLQQRQALTCGPGGVCTPLPTRLLTLVGLLIGAGLLAAGYIYV